MTLGEKLLECRRRAGLSQEELGKRLLVSRQTVSLWETDQTMPTVDNLLRLREIFGISMDALLDRENDAVVTSGDPAPREEAILFVHTPETLELLRRHSRRRVFRRGGILLILAFLFGALLGAAGAPAEKRAEMALALGAVFAAVLLFFLYRELRRIPRDLAQLKEKRYRYCLRDGGLYAEIHRDGAMVSSVLLRPECTRSCAVCGSLYLFTQDGLTYAVDRELAEGNPAIKACFGVGKVLDRGLSPENEIRAASFLLVLLCMASVPAGLWILSLANGQGGMQTRGAWQPLLLLPIPLASLVFGVHFLRRGFEVRKNLVFALPAAGFLIMLALL
ncbi:MAG: helix-turn-helix transcriptional regulator [Oscillospiraceae bacterium]|nr:helix-turn-helix transcriptional regulator [Oscillospiraceae bacterium]MBR4656903.1 helix-turn-helix transcriptional regulator [Oscillospiraceae bacterium]